MIVYGVALLSVCLVLGMLFGEVLGVVLNVEANVGGVGIAMLFLVFASNSDKFKALTEGVSAQQNDEEFEATLDAAIEGIYQASLT